MGGAVAVVGPRREKGNSLRGGGVASLRGAGRSEGLILVFAGADRCEGTGASSSSSVVVLPSPSSSGCGVDLSSSSVSCAYAAASSASFRSTSICSKPSFDSSPSSAVSGARLLVDGWAPAASRGLPLAAWISATEPLQNNVNDESEVLRGFVEFGLTFCRISRRRRQQALLVSDLELLLIQKLGEVGQQLVFVLGLGLHEICQLL